MKIPQILAQDKEKVLILKPAGMPTQPDLTGDQSAFTWAQEQLNQKLYLIHRLDRPVGGILVMAKTRQAAAYLSKKFRQRSPTLQKKYVAITHPPIYPPTAREITHYIRKDARRHKALISYKPAPGWEKAILSYETLACQEKFSLLCIEIHTGRFHQIRAQLAYMGYPIVGDVKYGSTFPMWEGGIALFAYQLMGYRAFPPPEGYWTIFATEINLLKNK
ncbi:MAG: RluA family pseudouridine synthase [Bacteroidia bacterium]